MPNRAVEDGPSTWVSVTHLENPGGFMGACPQPGPFLDIAPIWEVKQKIEDLYLSLSLLYIYIYL